MGHVKVILGILIALFVIVLAVQNNEAMNQRVQLRVNPVFAQERKSGDITIYQLVLVSFLLGVLGTGTHGMIERFRLKKQIKRLTRALQDKDKELSSLRNLPLTYENVGQVQSQGEST